MSKANAVKKVEELECEPIRPKFLHLAEHGYRQHDAQVPAGTTEEHLEDPRFWGHVAGKLQARDEIRVLAEDYSFRALLLCTYVSGTEVRMRVIDTVQVENVDCSDVENNDYEVKHRGVLKWCVVKKDTGENVKEKVPTKIQAMQELDDHVKMLAR